ncbi:hypothetical protein TWF703_010575 [Orbilia oligospora]|uniref:Uncharacterized protein n=2 Tax=Orbilia oligospora TaxID=2813651 RepID=A0A7C8P1L6_ORBOL|nr:hypothetical protein TWF703_010575 [Orbilia oligospora]
MARMTVSLPYDVLCLVAGFIASRRDLISFCQASRQTRDAAIPHIYNTIFFESWPDIETRQSTNQYTVGYPVKALFDLLNEDLRRPPDRQVWTGLIRSLCHTTVPDTRDKITDRTKNIFMNQLVYLIETLPRLQSLYIDTADLLIPECEAAISASHSINSLTITPHKFNSITCDSRRLAQSTTRFLPLWGNISSPVLKSLTITSLPPSHRSILDRTSVLGSVELWNIIANCPSLKHLDIRVKISGRDRGNNYIKDLAGRASKNAGLIIQDSDNDVAETPRSSNIPIVHLETLRLEDCTMAAFELNRLGPSSWKKLHIPFNGRKKLFKEIGNNGLTSNGERSMIFPRNLKSLVVDNLPLCSDRKEAWHKNFEKEFAELRLDELVVITQKADFWVGGTPSRIAGLSATRDGHDLSPNTRNEAVNLISGSRQGSIEHRQPIWRSTYSMHNDFAPNSSNTTLGSTGVIEPGMGIWLKRLLLKGSWAMTKGLVAQLLVTCYGLEEFGVALLWREWEHKISNFSASLKRLRRLKALIILNEPQSTNMNPEWGLPLPTKNKVWGSKLELEDDSFLQFGQSQEKLRYWGVGKKMWTAVLEESNEKIIWRRNNGEGSSRAGGILRRVFREIDRESVDGVKVLEWIRFCDEAWVSEGDDSRAPVSYNL